MSGSGSIADLRVGLGGLMRDRGDDRLDQLAHVDPLGLELAPSLAGEVEDRRDQPVHLGDGGFDEAERLGKILRQLLVGAFERRLGAVGGVVRHRRRRGSATRPSDAMRRKMSPRNSSSSLVKPMMLTSGERRSWLTI